MASVYWNCLQIIGLHFIVTDPIKLKFWTAIYSTIYCQTCNISHTLTGNKIGDHNYIFILNLTPGFNGLGKGNCKVRRESFKFWFWVTYIRDFTVLYGAVVVGISYFTMALPNSNLIVVLSVSVVSGTWTMQKFHQQVWGRNYNVSAWLFFFFFFLFFLFVQDKSKTKQYNTIQKIHIIQQDRT